MMLSKNAKKVLKLAQQTKTGSLEFSDIKKQFNVSFEAAKSAGDQLIRSDLAQPHYSRSMPGGRDIFSGITLTEEGRSSSKYFVIGIIDFIVKNLAIPIVVSVVTTLITLWLNGFWS